MRIEYVNNPIYDKTNNIYSLALAKEQMQEDDTLLIESDLIFDDKMFSLILDNPYPNLALVAKYETWMDGTMVCIDDENNIVNFVPKAAFQYEEVGKYYKTINIYKFSKEFSKTKYVPFLEAYTKAVGNNEYYENVLRIISFLNSKDLKALPITNEKWYEIDDKQDLDIVLRVIPSQANYFLVEVLSPFTANSLVLRMLKEHNILMRDCSGKGGFDGKQYMRIAVRNHEDNTKL